MTAEQLKKLVESYIPLANSMAWDKSRTTPRKVTIDELKSAAYMGLVKYASKFKSDDLSTFHPQARIKGEMLDYLRSIGWGTRGRKLAETSDFSEIVVEQEFYEEPDFSVLDGLEDNTKAILISKFVDDKRLREISQDVGLTMGRVSQIITEAKEYIRQRVAA